MRSHFCKAFDAIHTALSHDYAQAKEEGLACAEMARITSVALLATSLVCVGLGIVISAVGLYPVGLPIIFVFLPLGFLSYNSAMICTNAKIVAKNPKLCQPQWSFSLQLDEKKLKKTLLNGTFGAERILDALLKLLHDNEVISLRFSKRP